jgi:hypothetical protein
MSEIPSHEKYLRLAQEKESAFEWLEAEKNYKSAVSARIESGEYLEAGEAQERAAYCRHRAAYQSDTAEEFKALLESASHSHGKAAEIYEMLEGPKRGARVLTNRAMEHFYRSWLIEDPSERKTQVASCVERFKDALRACEDAEYGSRYGKVCNDFLAILYALSELAYAQAEGVEIIEAALDCGSSALEALEQGSDGYELARCHYLLSLFLPDRPMDVVESVERQQELIRLGTGHAEAAVELSEKAGDPYLIGLSCGILSLYLFEAKGDPEAAMPLARRQLEIGEKTGDRLVLARAHEHLSYYMQWAAALEEDLEKIRTTSKEAIRHADEAISHFKTILNPVITPFLPRNECHYYLSKVETDPELKRKYNIEGLEASYADLEYATKSGSLLGQMYIYSLLGSTYLWLAKFERDEHEKYKLLNDSMRFKKKYIDSAMEAQPFRYWNISGAYKGLADLKAQLAKGMDDREKRTELLSEAVADIEKSIELFNAHNRMRKITRDHKGRAVILLKFGEILFQTYLSSDDERYLEKAVQSFDDAVEAYEEIDMPIRIAEILWKMAWAHYQVRDYSKSAAEFDDASKHYLQAGEKFPDHGAFYADYGNYMEAWKNIASAMDCLSRDEYALEKEFFEKAVRILMSSERWRYLSPNYLAWARLAEAENHSRDEKCEKAIELFQESSSLFSSAKKSIEDGIGSIGVIDEVNMAAELMIASELRRDYCLGRAALEEAKILDRRGEPAASSRRYGAAAQIFVKIVDAMKSEPERREIRPLHSLCVAWQKMTQAEAEASPDLYLEASAFFEEAREQSPNEKTRLLTMGHASFCRALGAGIRYEVTREEQFHQELVLHIGSATDFYVRAGFETALDYSKATQRLFEAYQYMDRARVEADPGEKAKYFTMAERLLGISADAFQRAGHPAKRDEIERILRSLRQDREIAVSLSKILDTPGISSSTESFRAPTPRHEYPAGLEVFEHADIRAKMFLTSGTIMTGAEFELEFELHNPGKASASLVRIENLIPGDLEAIIASGYYRYDGENLDLRGKRIGPLGTLEITLKATPLSKGEYTLSPRVVFLDDAGEYKTSEPEPTTITVKEMGILSWLRGSRKPR